MYRYCAVEAITQKWSGVSSYIRQRKQLLVDCILEVHAFYELYLLFIEYLSRVESAIECASDSAQDAAISEQEHEHKQQLSAVLQTRFNKIKKLFFDENLKEFESDYEAYLFRWTNINLKLYISEIDAHFYMYNVNLVQFLNYQASTTESFSWD